MGATEFSNENGFLTKEVWFSQKKQDFRLLVDIGLLGGSFFIEFTLWSLNYKLVLGVRMINTSVKG